MAQWEYHVRAIDSGSEREMDILNELGSDGWELVAVTPETGGKFLTTYLKRPKRPDPAADLTAQTGSRPKAHSRPNF